MLHSGPSLRRKIYFLLEKWTKIEPWGKHSGKKVEKGDVIWIDEPSSACQPIFKQYPAEWLEWMSSFLLCACHDKLWLDDTLNVFSWVKVLWIVWGWTRTFEFNSSSRHVGSLHRQVEGESRLSRWRLGNAKKHAPTLIIIDSITTCFLIFSSCIKSTGFPLPFNFPSSNNFPCYLNFKFCQAGRTGSSGWKPNPFESHPIPTNKVDQVKVKVVKVMGNRQKGFYQLAKILKMLRI